MSSERVPVHRDTVTDAAPAQRPDELARALELVARWRTRYEERVSTFERELDAAAVRILELEATLLETRNQLAAAALRNAALDDAFGGLVDAGSTGAAATGRHVGS